MNALPLSSPALLHAVAVFILALSVLQVAAYSGVIALAVRRTPLPPFVQFSLPLLIGSVLALWLGWAALAAAARVIVPEPTAGRVLSPDMLLEMGAFAALGAAALVFSKSLRALYAATPPAWMVGIQIYRVAGLMFLWPFLASGALPPTFALVAGIGDFLTGLAAPFVALALARNEPGARARAVAWNWFGILDFVAAVTTAVLTGSTNIGRFPLVVVPLFVVPVGLLAHIYSLRNLGAAESKSLVLDPSAS